MIADAVDHVIPQIILRSINSVGDIKLRQEFIKQRTLEVPACTECNSLLGASYQETLAKRKKVLKQRLKKRHKKILKIPDWNEKDIEELGDSLRQFVRQGQLEKILIQDRLRW